MTDWQPSSTDPGDAPQPRDPYPTFPADGYTVPPQLPVVATETLSSQNYSGWWRRGTDIARRGWKPLAALQAVGVLLGVIVGAPLTAWATLAEQDMNVAFTDPATPPDLSLVFAGVGLALAGILATIIVAGIITLASVHVGASIAIGAPVRIGDALRLAGRRVLPMLGWQLLAIPIYLAAFCACILPVFYVVAVFTVLPVIVAIERTNAISRSFSLFHGDVGASLGRIATILGITIGVGLVAGVLGTVIEAAMRASVAGSAGIVSGSIVSTALTAVVSGAVVVPTAPLTLAAYADMRARKDYSGGPTIAQQLGIAAPAV